VSVDPFYLGDRVAAIESWRVRIGAGRKGLVPGTNGD